MPITSTEGGVRHTRAASAHRDTYHTVDVATSSGRRWIACQERRSDLAPVLGHALGWCLAGLYRNGRLAGHRRCILLVYTSAGGALWNGRRST
jgi:hypothetical protein